MKIGLHMIVAGEAGPVISCIKSNRELIDCGVILVDSKESSDSLYNSLINLNIPNLIISRHVWKDSFAQARNEALAILLSHFHQVDYVYWVDGDDLWEDTTNLVTLRERLTQEQPDAVNLIYQYSKNTRLYRNRFWKVTNGKVPYYWRGNAHEVEWTDDVWPSVVNWDNFKIIHIKDHLYTDEKAKHSRNIELLQKGIKEDPGFARDYYYLGQELFDDKQYSEAIEALRSHNNLSASPAQIYQAYLLIIQAYLELKEYLPAQDAAYKAISVYPDSPFAYSLLGMVFVAQEKWENAILWFLKAISVPGAPVIFDYEALRTTIPLRWLSVCYEKTGDKASAQYYHYLSGKCNIDDGLRKRNGVWLACNRYLQEMESEHFQKTESSIDLKHYMLVENFNDSATKLGLLGAMSYNTEMKIVRILNEGSTDEKAVVYKGIPDYSATVTLGEKYRLQTIDYKELFRSEQFSLFEDFYNRWIDFAVKRSKHKLFSVVELGTDIGLSARLFKKRVEEHRGKEYYDITLVDTNLTKETWAIIDNENVFFIHMRAEDAAKYFEDRTIDILHMDLAPHSYEQAVDIFRRYESKLTEEGIMIWHDVGKSKRFIFGGRKFLDELRYPWCISYGKETSEMSDEAPAVIFRGAI